MIAIAKTTGSFPLFVRVEKVIHLVRSRKKWCQGASMTGLPESQSAFNSLGDFVPTGRKAKNLPVEQTGKELVSSNSQKGITLFHNTQRSLSHFEMEKLRETANSVRRMLPVTSKKRLTLWTFSVQFRMSLWPLINAHCDDRMALLITLKSKRFKASRRIDGLLSAELKTFPTSALQHVFSACTQNPAGVLSNHVIRRLFYTWDTKKTGCNSLHLSSGNQQAPADAELQQWKSSKGEMFHTGFPFIVLPRCWLLVPNYP